MKKYDFLLPPLPSIVLARYLSGLFLALGCLHSSMEVFVKLLAMVLQWPMELFDTTPSGRIISRFSKDIDTCDTILPSVLQQFLSTCFSVKNIYTYIQFFSYLFFFCFVFFVLASRCIKNNNVLSEKNVSSLKFPKNLLRISKCQIKKAVVVAIFTFFYIHFYKNSFFFL